MKRSKEDQELPPIQPGFTLIELLIVIAMIGVLASVLIAIINPLEMLARSRDAARRSSVEVLIKGASSYNIANNNQFPTSVITGSNWIDYLKNNNYIDAVPASISPLTGCTAPAGAVENDFCYVVSGTSQAVIYVGLESQVEKNKCTTSGTNPFYLWSSADNKVGTVCSTIATPNDPTDNGTIFSFSNYQ